MTQVQKPHSGSYLAAEGETWVTMAHYEELLAERDRLFEQYEDARDKWITQDAEFEIERTAVAMRINELKEQLEAARSTLREIEMFIEGRHKEGDTEYQVALLARAALNPASSSLNPQVHRDSEQGPNGEQEGVTECRACGASIAWGGEFPADCIRCGASFQDTREGA